MPLGWKLVALVIASSAAACGQPAATREERGPVGQAPVPGRTLVVAQKVEPATIAARPVQEAAYQP